MAAALPRNVELKLDQTLGQWRHWHCDPPLPARPAVVRSLGRGISNHSILVGEAQQFVVRIDGISPTRNGINRNGEWRTLESAAAAGLAPTPRYFNPELGCLVCDYLPADEAAAPQIAEIAALLQKIHRLPPRHNRLDLGERILRYEKLLAHSATEIPEALSRHRQQLLDILAATRRNAPEPVLCHNDLLQANRIHSGGRLWAIDWEYCAMGDPWYELAVISVGDALDDSQTGELVDCYLGRSATARERLRLQQHCTVYRYLELLWYLALDRQLLTPASMADKVAGLERSLLNP